MTVMSTNGAAFTVNVSLKSSSWVQSQRRQNALNSCVGHEFLFANSFHQYHSNLSLCPTTDAKEAEQSYKHLQDLLQLIPKKDVLIITQDWMQKQELKRYLE